MSKYDIHKNKELPSDEEINKYKNFDKVVKKAAMLDYKQATKPIYKNAKVLSAVAVIIAVGLIILFETTEQDEAAEKVIEQKDSIKSNSPVQQTDSVKPAKPTSVITPAGAATRSQSNISATTEQQTNTSQQANTAVENTVITNENALAAFPGGDDALKNFLLKNIKYPYNAVESPYTGKIEVDLLIEKSGKIGNITIYHSPNPAISTEIKRVIGNMPEWKPCVKHGQTVPSTVTVYFPFTYVGE
ncbi:energy transducer TonB [Cytophaga hutchinsonii]|nr:energy transducer TonB [Cytophaga hutchinsonii]SFX27721.1 protein TonB, links inner and outer membranes [Cytophaga hutchinsonii ATCC 33406]